MIKNLLNKPHVKQILIILFASFFVCIPLLSSDINISYDDGVQHIARLIGTEASIKEGQTAIMSDFCNGFGYSWNLFYSPITSLVPLVFRIFGLSYINCIKCFMFVITLLSGIAMYFCALEITKNKKIALIAGIIYIFAPYRFTDMYIRNALAELTSFAFIPMVFQGLYGILKNKNKREILFIIGTCLLVLTHTIIAMYMAIICFVYLLTQFKKLKIKPIRRKLIASLFFVIVITAFFWMPLLQIKNSTNYEVFKPGRMERTDVLIAFKLEFKDLFITGQNNNMIYDIGLLNILVLILTPLALVRFKEKYKETDYYRFYIFSICAMLILLFMTLKIFPFENMPSILKMIQFTFRLLEFTSFFISIIVAINIVFLINKIKYKDIIAILIVLMFLSSFYIVHLYYSNNLNEDWLVPSVPVTENTGRVHPGCASFEYLPCKAFENRKYIESRTQDVIANKENVIISNVEKNGCKLEFNIENITEETELELPYIYYPGYNVKIENSNEKIETYETEKGFVGIKLPIMENGKIYVEYTGTSIMKISKLISLLGLCAFVLLLIIDKYYHKNRVMKYKM